MKVSLDNAARTIKTEIWCVTIVMIVAMVVEVASLNGPNVCMVKQKYNITKRVKYRAPMSIRTYEWCFSIPPRCSKWSTEMRDLTKLQTEERTAEVAVCCPGYKMKDVSCVPICPNGKTGSGCSEDCPPNKWGPNCVNECKNCSEHGICSPITGECRCQDGWQGESCNTRMSTTTTSTTVTEELLTTTKSTTKTTTQPTTHPTTRSTTVKSTTSSVTSPMTTSTNPPTTTTSTTVTSTSLTTVIPGTINIVTTPKSITTEKNFNEITSTEKNQYNNTTLTTSWTMEISRPTTEEVTERYLMNNSVYNKTEIPFNTTQRVTTTTEPIITTTEMRTTLVQTSTVQPTTIITTHTIVHSTDSPKTSTLPTTTKETIIKVETTRKPETTRTYPTTVKFRPKEIWIRPAQKGETFAETKIKNIHELPHSRYRNSTKKELASENTTPRTIIVSIIPTSITYSTFKKIALTTASFISQKRNMTKLNNPTEPAFTKSMSIATSTSAPRTIKIMSTTPLKNINSSTNPSTTQIVARPYTATGMSSKTTSALSSNATNSMSSTLNAVNTKNSSNTLTTVSISSTNVTIKRNNISETNVTTISSMTTEKTKPPTSTTERITTEHVPSKVFTIKLTNATTKLKALVTDNPIKKANTPTKKPVDRTNDSKKNLTIVAKSKTDMPLITTEVPTGNEETFHILTEPEHITAVMGEKGSERSSVDLISVISIAGGVMMAVITVAVVIVMLERCRKPRYEDARKMNDIRMQVMIDNTDVPPPYVRSIFHTPLPDPPTSEKCHYQPISTLDRNLKQFMRPVVVQTISPIMLENFRGILECHYDHLPRRSQDFGTLQTRCSTAPSIVDSDELCCQGAVSVTESTIESLKCEAKFDVIDSTTSEPLYAEIPCWRPPSEHAIEIVNLNGEAVTEL